jgi:transposase InsO family protein
MRRDHPGWGPSPIRWELERAGVVPLPGRSGMCRALIRHGLVNPEKSKRRREDYRRWERGRAMDLWQMDVMGRVHLAGGVEVKVVTGIDDHSRFVVCAKAVMRATARPVCQALGEALRRHGVPEQILTDNGKVFTARFGRGPGPVLFDRICADNGIKHLLTRPYSPTTTGKVERLHKTMRAEFFRAALRPLITIADVVMEGLTPSRRKASPRSPQSINLRAVAGRPDVLDRLAVPRPRDRIGTAGLQTGLSVMRSHK